jgi:serine/threonine-protein kinase
LPYNEAADLLLQACEAIAEAHSLGIVPRDLKPANLFRILRSDGTPSVKVLDFGISKVKSGTDASMTQTSSMMGSPYDRSPEQMTSAKNVDHRTDIWALGVILHELLTGKVPYQGETIPEICAQVLQIPPPPLSSLRDGAPIDLERVINRALEKNREDRFEDVAAFASAIAPFGHQYSHRHVERISKVLGVAPTIRGSSPDDVRVAGVQTAAMGSKQADNDDNDDSRSATTLGGAAHTQLDYRPPTTASKLPIIAAAAIVLAGGISWAVLSGSGDNDATAEETGPEGAAAAEQEGADPPADKAVEEPKPEPEPEPEKPEAKEEPAAEEKPAVAPKPAPVAAPKPTPAPRPAVVAAPPPAPRPAPRPVAAPKPTPKPSSSSLYLDRK